jgi:hypothetical protein
VSSNKAVLYPFPLFKAVTFNTNKTSQAINVRGLDMVFIDFGWTAGVAIAGTVDVEYLRFTDTNGDQTWEALNVDPLNSLAITGASGKHQLFLNGAGSPFPLTDIRVLFTRSAGTASLTCYISGKGV